MKKHILLLLLILPVLSIAQMRTETKKFSSDGYYNVAIPTHKPVKGIVFFLPGMGERTNTLEAFNGASGPWKTEIPKLLKDTTEYPYIFVWPQLHTNKTDYTKDEINPMLSILDLLSQNHTIPIHLTGLSLGGRGCHLTLRLAYAFHNGPGFFTTAGIVCGSTAMQDTASLKAYQGNLKIMLWHGSNDQQVLPGPDRALFKKLFPIIGDNIKLIEWPEGHEIWSRVYKNEYFPWLDSVTIPVRDIQSIKQILIVDGVLYIQTERGEYIGQLTKIK